MKQHAPWQIPTGPLGPKRKGRALYRIELHGKIMPFGRFFSWTAAMDFLESKFGKESEMLAVFEIIDDNGIPF